MEKIKDWRERTRANYCTARECVPECLYYQENGRIEDDQVIKEYIESIKIIEIEDYKKDLEDGVVNSILNQWNQSENS